MWCLGTWFSDGLGNNEMNVGLDDLRGILEPQLLYEQRVKDLALHHGLSGGQLSGIFSASASRLLKRSLHTNSSHFLNYVMQDLKC